MTQQNHVCCFQFGARHSKTTSAAFTSGPDTAKPRLLLSLWGQTQQNHVCCFHFGSSAFTLGLLSLHVWTQQSHVSCFRFPAIARPVGLWTLPSNLSSKSTCVPGFPIECHDRGALGVSLFPPRKTHRGSPFPYVLHLLGLLQVLHESRSLQVPANLVFPKNTAIAGPCESFFPQEECIGFTPHPVRGSAGVHHAGSLRVPSFLTNTAIAGPCGSPFPCVLHRSPTGLGPSGKKRPL